mmetsp:Transcript_15258/g.50739  ORF Transcript_15258/g.50739 Transcript_15258/m.50739 type:complete len:241 (-) Transcript_15258:563-1285(-)
MMDAVLTTRRGFALFLLPSPKTRRRGSARRGEADRSPDGSLPAPPAQRVLARPSPKQPSRPPSARRARQPSARLLSRRRRGCSSTSRAKAAPATSAWPSSPLAASGRSTRWAGRWSTSAPSTRRWRRRRRTRGRSGSRRSAELPALPASCRSLPCCRAPCFCPSRLCSPSLPPPPRPLPPPAPLPPLPPTPLPPPPTPLLPPPPSHLALRLRRRRCLPAARGVRRRGARAQFATRRSCGA